MFKEITEWFYLNCNSFVALDSCCLGCKCVWVLFVVVRNDLDFASNSLRVADS